MATESGNKHSGIAPVRLVVVNGKRWHRKLAFDVFTRASFI